MQYNRVVDLNKQVHSYYKYMKYVSVLIDEDDILKISTCRKILKSNIYIESLLTSNMSELNAERMIQIIGICAILFYQNIYPGTFYTYFLTNFSGLKKIYNVIFKNPLYGLLFYLTFYFKILVTSDQEYFNKISEVLNLPKHEDYIGNKFLDNLIDNSTKILNQPLIKYKRLIKDNMKKMVNNIIHGSLNKKLDNIFSDTLKTTIGKEDLETDTYAIYNGFDYDDKIILEHLEMLEKNQKIKKFLRDSGVKLKNKKIKKQKIIQVSQLKDIEGNVICLDKCKNRVKTKSGCYCESDCGPSHYLGKQSWCWVDKNKCKKKKSSLKTDLFGNTFDLCNKEEINNEKTCFTGYKYSKCKIIN